MNDIPGVFVDSSRRTCLAVSITRKGNVRYICSRKGGTLKLRKEKEAFFRNKYKHDPAYAVSKAVDRYLSMITVYGATAQAIEILSSMREREAGVDKLIVGAEELAKLGN